VSPGADIVFHGVVAFVFWWFVVTAVVIGAETIVRRKPLTFRSATSAFGIPLWIGMLLGLFAAGRQAAPTSDLALRITRAILSFVIWWAVISLGVVIYRSVKNTGKSVANTFRTSFPWALVLGALGLFGNVR